MTAPTQATKPRPGPVRRTFRWCRRTVLLLLFLVVVAVLYLNQIGLPDFAKGPLLAQLRERGIDLEFSRIRLRFGRGVVVEHVNLSRHAEVAGEQFHAEELQLRLRWSALLELRAPEVVAFALRDGSVLLPLTEGPGEPPFPFAIDHVQARVLFSGPEHWELESLDATSHVGAFHAHGTLTNVSVLRSTRVRSLDGFLITVPNKTIGNTTIVNITRRPTIKTEINLGITYDTTAERTRYATQLLEEIFRAHPRTADAVVTFNKFLDSSLNIQVLHWWQGTDAKLNMADLQDLNLEVKRRFDAERIEFAFPTQTVLHRPVPGP